VAGKVDDLEIADFSGVYKEMNDEGKKKMALVAGKLLSAQKIFENAKRMYSHSEKEDTMFKDE
jgi:hypothetical protein